jgi:RNA polymerase sigma-70 factor (ECF subfamily)
MAPALSLTFPLVAPRRVARSELRSRVRTPSLAEVYEQHFEFVFRCALRLGVPRDEAPDVVQDVFLVVHRRLGDFEARSSLRTWLFGILRRVASDRRRRAYRRRECPRAEVEAPALADCCPERCAERREAARLLHAILAELSEEKREVFILSELEQLSAPEIAEAVGANLNTIYARIRAARRDFERALARRRARDAFGGGT